MSYNPLKMIKKNMKKITILERNNTKCLKNVSFDYF